MWVRGLKPRDPETGQLRDLVASYVGAWIETLGTLNEFSGQLSHPMWVRGLKQDSDGVVDAHVGRILCGCVD